MILFEKIEDYREITDADRRDRRLWMAVNDSEGSFLVRIQGDISRREWKNKVELYRIDQERFAIDYQCESLHHPEVEGSISGEFTISGQLLPGTTGMLEFIRESRVTSFTTEDLQNHLFSRGNLLRNFIENVISVPSLDELLKSTSPEVNMLAGEIMPEWLDISRVEIKTVSQELSDAEKKLQAYNLWVQDNEDVMRKQRKQLDFDVEQENIDHARAELIHQRELQEIKRRNDVEKAKIEFEYAKEKLALEKDAAQMDLRQREERAERFRKIAEIRLKTAEDKLLNEQKIAEHNREIRSAVLARMKQLSEQDAQLAALQQEKARLEIEKLKSSIQNDQTVSDAHIKMVQNGEEVNTMLLTMMRETTANMLKIMDVSIQKVMEKMGDVMKNAATSVAAVSSVSPVRGSFDERGRIIDSFSRLVQQQDQFSSMHLNKKGLITEKNSRSIGLEDLEIETEVQTIRIHQPIQLTFTSPINGYLTLICLGSAGDVTVLSPNFLDGSSRLYAGENYMFPNPDGSMLRGKCIRETGPAGRDTILSLVTPEPLISVPVNCRSFFTLSAVEVENIFRKLQQFPIKNWSAGYCSYIVEDTDPVLGQENC